MTAFKISIISVLMFFNTTSHAQDENLSPKWKELFSKYSDIQQLCMKKGLEFYTLKIISMDPNAQLVEPNDPKVKPIYETCEKFLAKKLRVEQPCNMKNSDGSPSKSVCSDVYIVEKDGKKLRTTVDRAIVHTFEGLPLSIAFIELKEAAESRAKAEEQTREKTRLEEESRIAEEKRIEEYKKSPAYKKELADLAMKKALEDAKNKNDLAEQEKKYISDLTKTVECNKALYTKGFVIQDKATNDADKIPGARLMKIAEIWINYVGTKFGSQKNKRNYGKHRFNEIYENGASTGGSIRFIYC